MKRKQKPTAPPVPPAAPDLSPTQLYACDAEERRLYANCEKNPTVLWLLKKNVRPDTHLIAFWADTVCKWLELRVRDKYKLETCVAFAMLKIQRRPLERDVLSPDYLGKRTRAVKKAAPKKRGKQYGRKEKA